MLMNYLEGRALHVSSISNHKVMSYHNGLWTTLVWDDPRGVCVDEAGTVYAVGSNALRMFTPDGFMKSIVYYGEKFLYPHGSVVVEGHCEIASASESSIYRFDLAGHEFHSVWRVPGVDESTDNRSHISGVSAQYVTLLAQTNEPSGWRKAVELGRAGCVVDRQTNEVVINELVFPHSPVEHNGKLYFLNSGVGEFCVWDDGSVEVIHKFSGFCRGLTFLNDRLALVGISQGRVTAVESLTIDVLAQPGIAVVDYVAGKQLAFYPLDVQEVFEVCVSNNALRGI